MEQFKLTCVGQKPVVSMRTVSSTPPRDKLLLFTKFLNSSMIVLETDISLNMPSSFEVN